MFGDTMDVSGQMRKGDNVVRITLTNSLRNMLGNLHSYPNPEPVWTGTEELSRYGKWNGGRAEGYTDNYNFVRFGIESIDIG